MISQQDIERIMDAARIEQVVGDFVDLKRRGVNYIGLCPFHDEKTPSFNVNPARGIFKCFGCGEGGDSVSFLMKYQHYTYPEALRYLAAKYGIEIQETELSAEEKQSKDEKDALYNINEFAKDYYYNNLLNTEEGKSIGLTYFNEREILPKTIDTWGLGYALQKGDSFTRHALKSGYSEELLIQSGLSIKSEKDGSLYDRFRARVTFPIYNAGGRVLGFSARILSKDKAKAKYVNSPESPIYIKGKTLFGLNFARNEIAKKDMCYLVEGNVDAIMMHQNEVKNVIATCGTALTENQIQAIKRFTSNIVVLYDGDAAGIHAAMRATDMFLKEGMHIKIVLFPDGDDPDSFARKHTQDEFHAFLQDNAQNFILYKTTLLMDEAKQDPDKKASLIKDVIHSISLIPDLIERTTYIKQCAKIMDMSEELLSEELSKQIIHNTYQQNKQKDKFTPSQQPVNQPDDTLPEIKEKEEAVHLRHDISQETGIIRILVNYAERDTRQLMERRKEDSEETEVSLQTYNAGAFIIADIINNGLTIEDPVCRSIFEKYTTYLSENKQILPLKQLMQQCNEKENNLISGLLARDMSISKMWQEKHDIYTADPMSDSVMDKDIKETCLYFKLSKIDEMMQNCKQKMKLCEKDEEAMTLMHEFQDLTYLKKMITRELNITVR